MCQEETGPHHGAATGGRAREIICGSLVLIKDLHVEFMGLVDVKYCSCSIYLCHRHRSDLKTRRFMNDLLVISDSYNLKCQDFHFLLCNKLDFTFILVPSCIHPLFTLFRLHFDQTCFEGHAVLFCSHCTNRKSPASVN